MAPTQITVSTRCSVLGLCQTSDGLHLREVWFLKEKSPMFRIDAKNEGVDGCLPWLLLAMESMKGYCFIQQDRRAL